MKDSGRLKGKSLVIDMAERGRIPRSTLASAARETLMAPSTLVELRTWPAGSIRRLVFVSELVKRDYDNPERY